MSDVTIDVEHYYYFRQEILILHEEVCWLLCKTRQDRRFPAKCAVKRVHCCCFKDV